MDWTKTLNNLGDGRWEIPKTYKEGMRVPGIIFADEALLPPIIGDPCLDQVVNVAFLPGIVGYSLATAPPRNETPYLW